MENFVEGCTVKVQFASALAQESTGYSSIYKRAARNVVALPYGRRKLTDLGDYSRRSDLLVEWVSMSTACASPILAVSKGRSATTSWYRMLPPAERPVMRRQPPPVPAIEALTAAADAFTLALSATKCDQHLQTEVTYGCRFRERLVVRSPG